MNDRYDTERQLVREWLSRDQGVVERLDERTVSVPSFISGEAAESFIARLDSDDTVDVDVIDPDTGEILLEPGEPARSSDRHPEWKRQRDVKRKKLRREYDREIWLNSVASLDPVAFKDEFEQAYDVKVRFLVDTVDDPGFMRAADYDIEWDVPTDIERRDGGSFTENDIDNIADYVRAYNDILPQGIKLDHSINRKGGHADVYVMFV